MYPDPLPAFKPTSSCHHYTLKSLFYNVAYLGMLFKGTTLEFQATKLVKEVSTANIPESGS